jgi:hypothetical protein
VDRGYEKRRYGVLRPWCSRLAFQIWPHAVQRQYVETSTGLLVVVTSTELQKGQHFGATVASEDSEGLVYTACLSPILALAQALFGSPLMADGPETVILIAPQP